MTHSSSTIKAQGRYIFNKIHILSTSDHLNRRYPVLSYPCLRQVSVFPPKSLIYFVPVRAIRGSFSEEIFLNNILHILPDQLLHPRAKPIIPPLRMCIQHNLIRQQSLVRCLNNIPRISKPQISKSIPTFKRSNVLTF